MVVRASFVVFFYEKEYNATVSTCEHSSERKEAAKIFSQGKRASIQHRAFSLPSQLASE